MKRFSCLLLFITLYSTAIAQTFTISGTIKDSKGSPLMGAQVSLAGYKTLVTSDEKGNFKFLNLRPAGYDVLVRMVGFEPFQTLVTVDDKNATVSISLSERVEDVEGIDVVQKAGGNINRAAELRLFTQQFLGTTTNAAKSTIVNPETLYFIRNKNKLKVTAADFIEIENQSLGYRVRYLLKHFEYDADAQTISYHGYATFEDLKDPSKELLWERNRRLAYEGSIQHFFKSVGANITQKEGFVVYPLERTMLAGTNVQVEQRSGSARSELKLSANNSNADDRQLYVYAALKDSISVNTLMYVDKESGQRMLRSNRDLLIIYTKEKENNVYGRTGFRIDRPGKYSSAQVSQIHLVKNPLAFSDEGFPNDITDCTLYGYWAYEKVAELLPLDY